ncbi:MAG: hypothetical protein AAGA18_12150 [Verrucomicrobiota bacterium]
MGRADEESDERCGEKVGIVLQCLPCEQGTLEVTAVCFVDLHKCSWTLKLGGIDWC